MLSIMFKDNPSRITIIFSNINWIHNNLSQSTLNITKLDDTYNFTINPFINIYNMQGEIMPNMSSRVQTEPGENERFYPHWI